GVDRAADLARVAVLVGRAASRAFPLDVAISQEHALDRIVELLDLATIDEAGLLERQVDALREFDVLGGIGAVPMVEGDMEAVVVGLAPGRDTGDELLRTGAGLLGGDHDRRAMG